MVVALTVYDTRGGQAAEPRGLTGTEWNLRALRVMRRRPNEMDVFW